MDTGIQIDLLTGIYDAHFSMTNALYDFIINNDFDWIDKTQPFLIKKGIHLDGNIEYFFTFSHKGVSYHAYTTKVFIKTNGRIQEIRLKIYRITSLNIYSVK